MNSDESWYEILEIPTDAGAEDIRLAYFEQARLYHPDTNQSEIAREWFYKIQEAYDCLSDPEKRKHYDNSIKGRSNPKENVRLSLQWSSNEIPHLNEPQLVYCLLELKSLIETEPAKKPQSHVCIVVDCSTSMKGNRIEMVRENLLRLTGSLKKEDLFSIVIFNDKAEILLTPTRVEEIQNIGDRLSTISCFGGTEIYKGLKAGMDLLWGSTGSRHIKQMILLTDGHTYGDDEACYELAKKMQSKGIILNTLGIGHEWNDTLLDKLAGSTGGSSVFIEKSEDLKKYVKKFGESIFIVAADNVNLDLTLDPGVELSSIFRLKPGIAELTIDKPIALGDIYQNRVSTFLLSFIIPPIGIDVDQLTIAKGKIRYSIVNSNTKMKLFRHFNLPVKGTEPCKEPPKEIIEALTGLTIFQMQKKANQEVQNGNIDQAIHRLGYISTQLLRLGEPKLAKKVQIEADLLKTNKKYSLDGDKQLKYGTRSLIAPENEKREL